MSTSGDLVVQKKEEQEYLDSEILGESNLIDGRKYIVTRKENIKTRQEDLICMMFKRNGKAKIVTRIPEFERYMKELTS